MRIIIIFIVFAFVCLIEKTSLFRKCKAQSILMIENIVDISNIVPKHIFASGLQQSFFTTY
jgi:hypothetical protein